MCELDGGEQNGTDEATKPRVLNSRRSHPDEANPRERRQLGRSIRAALSKAIWWRRGDEAACDGDSQISVTIKSEVPA